MDQRAERILSPALVVAALMVVVSLALQSPPGPERAGRKALPRRPVPTRDLVVAPLPTHEPAPAASTAQPTPLDEGAPAFEERLAAAPPRPVRVRPTSVSEPAGSTAEAAVAAPADPGVVVAPPAAAAAECPPKPRGRSDPEGNALGHDKDRRCRE